MSSYATAVVSQQPCSPLLTGIEAFDVVVDWSSMAVDICSGLTDSKWNIVQTLSELEDVGGVVARDKFLLQKQ